MSEEAVAEMRNTGRKFVRYSGVILMFGMGVGAALAVIMLLPLVPPLSAVRALVFGFGTGVAAAISIYVVYRLGEDRLIEMYRHSDYAEDGGGAS